MGRATCLPYTKHVPSTSVRCEHRKAIYLFQITPRFRCGTIPLTHWLPELSAKKAFFGHFGAFLGWIAAKLALMWSKIYLHHDSLAFLPLASRFMTFWLGHAQKSKFWESGLRLKAFRFWDFFLAFPFSPLLSFCSAFKKYHIQMSSGFMVEPNMWETCVLASLVFVSFRITHRLVQQIWSAVF